MKKKYIIYGVLVVLILCVGVSYSYFSAIIKGEGKNIKVTAGKVNIIFTDNIEIADEDIKPDWNTSKTFTIKNESSKVFYYDIILKDLINTFVTEDFLQYRITSTDGYNMSEFKTIEKSDVLSSQVLANHISIKGKDTQTYTIEFRYVDSPDIDQSMDMGKTFSGSLSIIESTPIHLYSQILEDHPSRGTERPNAFDGIYIEENTKTLYETTKTENGNKSYYFAGNALDNWVYFAGFYWRIIRINEDNSVRLLYVGPDKNTTSGYINETTYAYNSTENHPRYVGYMYGQNSTDLASDRGNNTNSTIKGVIDGWYGTNITGKNDGTNTYDKYVSRTAIYCNDRSILSGSYSTSTYFNFGALIRLFGANSPSYKCGANTSNGLYESSQAIADKFSGSTTGGGNGLLSSAPTALMTADEIAYAGGFYGTSAKAWYYYNALGENITENNYWWIMSPANFNVNADINRAIVMTVGGSPFPGGLGGSAVNLDYVLVVRPALSLKSCVVYESGDGTSDNPYRVSIGNKCANALN